MKLKQYYLGCLAHASYLIADEQTGIAAVVDPQRDIDQYLKDAQANNWRIEHVFLTHFHADFLAGHIELRNRTHARIYLGAKAQAEYAFTPLHEGDQIEFGQVRLQILETPGHTPEGISILVYDLADSVNRPQAVLTGDTLFIGDVGRPDLMASVGVTAEQLAEMLYDSLTNKLLKLPDETLVYPAHGAGSMCGKRLSSESVSTIGEQKKFNYALQPMSRERFSKLVTADQPEAPAYFGYDALRNRQERPSLEESMRTALQPMPLDGVLRVANRGGQLVDVREGADFDAAHLDGALNVGLRGKYATWAGSLLDKEASIVVIADPGSEVEAVMRLGRIGFDNVAGYLDGGMAALEYRPDLVRTVDRITARALMEELGREDVPTVLDVRNDTERAEGYIEGSLHIPLNHLRDRINELPRDGHLVVHCQSGYRSAIGVSLLQRAGFENLLDLVGGFSAWAASSLPVSEQVA